MAKNRYINTKFWNDNYISNLDPIEKLLFLYLLTNTATNISGCYELPLKTMSVDTGIEKTMIEKILVRFKNDNKIVYKNGWLVIKNFLKHQNTRSPKIQKGIQVELESVPDDIKSEIYPIDTVSHSNTIQLNTNTIELNEKEEEKPINNKSIVDKYFELHEKHTGAKPIFGAKDGKLIKDLLTNQTEDIILKKLSSYYSKDYWFNKDGRSLGNFKANYNAIEIITTNNPVTDPFPWVQPGEEKNWLKRFNAVDKEGVLNYINNNPLLIEKLGVQSREWLLKEKGVKVE